MGDSQAQLSSSRLSADQLGSARIDPSTNEVTIVSRLRRERLQCAEGGWEGCVAGMMGSL